MKKPKIFLAAHEVSFIKSGRRQQWLARVLEWGALVAILALAVTSFVLSAKSRKAAEEAREIAVTSFVRTIGSSESALSKEELNALWDRAEVEAPLEPVRTAVLEQWFISMPQFLQAIGGNGQGLRAAVGISSNRTNIIVPVATALAHKTVAAMKNNTDNPDALSILGSASGHLSDKLPLEMAAEGAERLLAARWQFIVALRDVTTPVKFSQIY